MTAVGQDLGTGLLSGPVARLFRPAAVRGPGEVGRVGLEIELIPVSRTGATPRPVPVDTLAALLGGDPRLDGLAALSFEPGGQLELSLTPVAGAAAAVALAHGLVAHVASVLAAHGIVLVACGTNPWLDPDAVGLAVPKQRYLAMQEHFDRVGGTGRRMMRQTAALQVCLDIGDPGTVAARWALLNRAGPVLAAVFANSPFLDGATTGAASTRSQIWQAADASRTGFDGAQCDPDAPAPAYAAFAAAAEAIPLRRADAEPLPARTAFAAWMTRRGEAGRPDGEDVDHHLSTLFPPVRPRGYLEVRYLDALPARLLGVAVAVLAALVDDGPTRREALAVLAADGRVEAERWRVAAALGVRDPVLRAHGLALLDAAAVGLRRLGPAAAAPGLLAGALPALRERLAASRCPGDELVEGWDGDTVRVAAWS